jgi:hypothetical protein
LAQFRDKEGQVKHVAIRVQGQIDQQWSEWFGNLTIMSVGQEQSLLTGIVPDQAALYGILTKLRDLSLALISVSVDADAIEGLGDFKQKGETS